jgi:hypothetical protein
MFLLLFKVVCEAAGLAVSASVTLSTLRFFGELALVRTATGRVLTGSLCETQTNQISAAKAGWAAQHVW